MNDLKEKGLLRKNVKDLQEQLRNANIRIKTLTDEIHFLRKRVEPETSFSISDFAASEGYWSELEKKNKDKNNG